MPTLRFREVVIVVTLLAAVTAAYSQNKFKTIEVGVGPSMVSLHDNTANITNSPKLAFTADAAFSYFHRRSTGYVARLLFEQKGGKSVQALPPNIATGETEREAYLNTTSHYVTFAPGFRQYFGKSGFFAEGGPFLAFLVGSKTDRIIEGEPSQVTTPYNTMDVGASGSLGYTASRTQYNSFQLRLVNNIGLADVNHKTGTREWTNSLALIAAMRIRMRTR